jgi:tripartite-type tricarboxylate transporter receptor subunit TctC
MKKLFMLLAVLSAMMCYAAEPIKFIVPFAPGGPADALARALQTELSQELAQPVVIEYKLGAGGDIGAAYVANTNSKEVVLLLTSSGIVTNLLLKPTQSYDPNKLVLAGYIGTQSLVLVVGNKSPMKNFAEWRKSSSTASYGSSGVGSVTHIIGEVFAKSVNQNLQHIPYKGSAQATLDIVNGNVDCAFFFESHAMPFLQNQQLVAVAVAAPQRLTKLPDVPTFKELGIDKMTMQPWFALFANQSADAADLARVQSALTKVLKNTALFQKFSIDTTDTKISKDFLRQEQENYGRMVKNIKIQLE